ncbi:MAG: hypothetical protein NZM29_00510, partial [Nitrospira sp.]|nr:hypothetical protein [Nitrospira sp.]
GTTVAVGAASITVNGEIVGRVGQDFVVSRLVVANHLAAKTRDIRYTTPTLTGIFNHMTVSAKSRADLMDGPYVLDDARLTVGHLLDCSASGTFNPRNGQFSWQAAVPWLNVAELRHHLSGPDFESLASVNPAGRLALRISGSGSITSRNDLAQLRIPIEASMQVDLRDVAGSFQDHAIAGATGTIRLSMETNQREPDWHQLVRTSLQIGADRLALGGGAPVKQLEKFTLALEGSVEAFDHLILDRLVVGADGMDTSIEGEIRGIKRFLTSKGGPPLLEGLAPLFVKSRLNANLDLNRFADVARSFGISGSGRAGVNLLLHKKERGPLDIRATVLPQGLSVTQDANHVEDLDGAVEIRKVLQWLSPSDGSVRETVFRPTGLLPDLRLAVPARRDFRIRRVKAGPFEVRNLSGHLFLDNDRLVLQNLAMNLLGGGLGGEIVVTGGKMFRVDLRMEAAKLDANQLLPTDKQIAGDSLIDGTVTMTATFDDQRGRLDFGKSVLDLSLTRIGRHTLDRLLQFLDPTGSNPSIVGARSAVKLANPESARITMSKGLVAVRILFQQGLLSRFEMDRIPVSQIRHIRDLPTTLPQWNDIRRLMELLGASRYGVDQAGEFVLE